MLNTRMLCHTDKPRSMICPWIWHLPVAVEFVVRMHSSVDVMACCSYKLANLSLQFAACVFTSRCIEDLNAELSELSARRTKLVTEKAQAEDKATAAVRALPELEAAKKVAAAKKDFKVCMPAGI